MLIGREERHKKRYYSLIEKRVGIDLLEGDTLVMLRKNFPKLHPWALRPRFVTDKDRVLAYLELRFLPEYYSFCTTTRWIGDSAIGEADDVRSHLVETYCKYSCLSSKTRHIQC